MTRQEEFESMANDVGQNLHRIMAEKGHDILGVAVNSHLDTKTIARILSVRGENITLRTLVFLSRGLECDVLDLLKPNYNELQLRTTNPNP